MTNARPVKDMKDRELFPEFGLGPAALLAELFDPVFHTRLDFHAGGGKADEDGSNTTLALSRSLDGHVKLPNIGHEVLSSMCNVRDGPRPRY